VRVLYLHGFASGPRSTKGLAFESYFAERGVAIERLDLRVPSFEHLRLSAMIEHVRARVAEHTVIIGSSLGGLTAAHVAERDARVRQLVLLAPAFGLVQRWRETLGDAWNDWQRTGWREVTDYTTGGTARVDFGFIEDAIAVGERSPDASVPTLILHGVRDEVVPIERSRAFAANRPHVQLIELDDGHELVASLPRLLAESERFLAAG
jgi:pimeloyl-ACP methyl ester carboxylesterase